jgi:hypothetical protein
VTLARRGVAHPDPSVVPVALAAARAVQRWYLVVFVGLGVAMTAGALVFRAFFWSRTPAGFTAYLVLLGWLILASLVTVILLGAWGIWPLASAHLEAAGVRDLVARRPVAPAAPLTVPAAPRRWRLLLPYFALLLVGYFAIQTALPWWILTVACQIAAGGCTWLSLRRATVPRWARRRPRAGAPLLVLDQNGLSAPHLSLVLPWAGVTNLDLHVIHRVGLTLYLPDAAVGVPVEWMSTPSADVLAAIRDHLAARAATPAEG